MDPELHHLWVRFETALQTCLDSGGPARRHRAQGRPAVCVLRPLMALEILAAHHSNKSASECGLLYKSPRSVSVDLYQGFYSSATGSQQNRELSGSSNMTMQTAGRGLVVRGPVHGYLSVAAHKRLVVDTPITQSMVFPEAKTSRFVHSPGGHAPGVAIYRGSPRKRFAG